MAAEVAFDDLADDAGEVGGEPLVLPGHDGGVAGVVDDDGHRLLVEVVEADDAHGAVDGGLPVAADDDAAVVEGEPPVDVDGAGAFAGRHAHGAQIAQRLPAGAGDAAGQGFEVFEAHVEAFGDDFEAKRFGSGVGVRGGYADGGGG